jgi:phosphohistidine swiveling domain-containing protein
MIATKAESLEWLAPRLTRGVVLPLVYVRTGEWGADRSGVLDRVSAAPFASQPLMVRSSAVGEDGTGHSAAGHYLSIPNVRGRLELAAAIDRVVASYGDGRADHFVLVQPFLTDVVASGVVFTVEPSSGAPYFVVNYREGRDTSAVTSGRTNHLRTFYSWNETPAPDNRMLAALMALADELKTLTGFAALNFEFAYTSEDMPVLFQVRPLVISASVPCDVTGQQRALTCISARVQHEIARQPGVVGERTVFGIMPDWNPAEILGVRPRPLAFSLYRDLVTDSVWAAQRHRYGYRDLRGRPLLVDLHGLPYVDVRLSFNSFVPADLPGDLAERLVGYYVTRLIEAPELHDKVEFEIALSCYSFDLPQRLSALPDEFSAEDRRMIAASLRALTNRITSPQRGLWRADVERVGELQRRRTAVMDADLDPLWRIQRLLDDCRAFGTLAFAGLARTAFIAAEWLRALVRIGVMGDDDVNRLMRGLDSVSAAMGRDLRTLSRDAFLATYGHLRPGTYDILSARYDEAPDRYFTWAEARAAASTPPSFVPTAAQKRAIARLLREHGLAHDAGGFFTFVRDAIRYREQAKFVFTRSVSDVLALLGRLGAQHGFSLEELSFADIGAIRRARKADDAFGQVLGESIAAGRERYGITRQLLLPPLITNSDEVWQFHQPPTVPNFITQKEVIGPVCRLESSALDGRIVVLPNADPGFDWIFSRDIAGFITAYGGANSHMAVRAGELGLPAVIGAGESLYRTCARARRLRIDCLNRQVQILAS